MTTEQIKNLRGIIPDLVKIRREFHKYPELAFEEHKTTSYIKELTESWGLKLNEFQNLKTGGYCDVGEGDIIAFRSDIDALAIEENKDHQVCSNLPGLMHACGHDFHTTIGLGLLKYFKENEDSLKGRLRVIFQPGEEAAPGGAETVVKEDIWDNVKAILTTHVFPRLEVGKVILMDGPVQASSTSLFVEIKGKGGHTSKPHETADLINITGHYIVQVQDYIKQKTDSLETLVMVFGYVNGGNAHNVIPQTIQLRGTLRTLDNGVLKQSIELLKEFTSTFGKLYDVKINLVFPTSCPATINDDKLNLAFKECMNRAGRLDDVLMPKRPSMGADDFAFYLDKVPGLYLGVGAGGSGVLHSGDLELDENLIEPAVYFMAEYITCLFEYGF